MKKMVFLVSALVLVSACAMQTVKQDATEYAGKTRQQVYTAALMAIVDCGYTVTTSDKDAFLIVATKSKNWLTQNEAPHINVAVQENSQGVVFVKMSYVQPGQLVDTFGTGKKDIDKLKAAMQEYLK